MLQINAIVPLILLVALVLSASLHGLAASGHFPLDSRDSIVRPIALFGPIGLAVISLAAGVAAALHLVPWYAATIGSGLSVLAAPLVLQWFPDRFVDGRGALVGFAGLCAVLAILLIGLVKYA